MKLKTGKQIISVILTLTILFSMIALSVPQLSAATVETEKTGGYVKALFVDKAVDVGMRLICEGVLTLSESAEKAGNEDVAEVTAVIAEWGFTNADEAAASKAVEYCQEILAEVQELRNMVNENDAAIQQAVGELSWLQGKTNLTEAKKSDIIDVIDPLLGELGILDKFEHYSNTKEKYLNGEATGQELETAQLNFLHSLCSLIKSDVSVDEITFDAIGKVIFTNETVNSTLFNIIGTLSSNLTIDAIHDYNVMSYAMAYAYNYYPYSHQQYNFVMQQVKYQLDTLIEIMTMYNEVLALQYQYLEKNNLSFGNYQTWVDDFYGTGSNSDCMINRVSANILEMLEKEYQVASGTYLSLSDYMKPQDAVLTKLKVNDETYRSDGTTISQYNDFYKLMTMNGTDKNIYYLWDTTKSMSSMFGYSGSIVTNDFVNMEYPLSDGYNDFVVPSQGNIASKYSGLTDTNAFNLAGRVLRGVLYDFDSNGNSKSLIGSNTPMYLRTSTSVQNKEPVTTQVINVDNVFSGDVSTEEFRGDNTKGYYAVLSAPVDDSSVFSQQVSVESAGISGGEIKITAKDSANDSGNSVTVTQTDSKIIPSGNALTLKFKLPEGCTKFSIYCKRDSDSYSSSLSRVTNEELLDETMLDYLTVDSEGYYSFNYTMPYSQCTFELYLGDFDRDEQGRVVIKNYDDLKAVAYQINTHPELYASLEYVLANNITVPSNSDLQPIAKDSVKFSGVFDGQNYTIDNLNFDNSYSACGLFGNNAGTVKNIKFTNANVSGYYAGVACGLSSGTIDNITVADSTVNSEENGGGICGKASGGTIKNCSVKGTTVAGTSKTSALLVPTFGTGGIAGLIENGTTVESCESSATVTGTISNASRTVVVGGIVGTISSGTVKGCINTGTVKSLYVMSYVGGVAGALMDGKISGCGNIGTVTLEGSGGSYIGGVLGLDFSSGIVENSYSGGTTSLGSNPHRLDYAGGLIGYATSLTVQNCYFDSEVSNLNAIAAKSLDEITVTDVEAKTTAQFNSGEVAYLLNNAVTDGTQVWYQNLDNGDATEIYPVPFADNNSTVYKVNLQNKAYSNFSDGVPTDLFEKTSDGSYIIDSYDKFCIMANLINTGIEEYINGDFVITDEIDCTGKPWTQIGTDTIQFNGTLDGQGNSIVGLSRDAGIAEGARHGLFAVLGKNAVVKNIVFSKADIFPSESPVIGAGVIAKQNNGKISNCIIKDSYIQLGNWVYLGGVAGLNTETGIIENCAVINTTLMRRWGASTTGSMGGISETNKGSIENCYTYGCSYKNGGIKAPITASGNSPENCYYYTTTAVDATYGIAKDTTDFARGEVAYLLNNGVTDGTQAWYQNIGGENADAYPVLDSSHNTVYKSDDYTNGDLIGDINGDNSVTEEDVNLLGKYLIREVALTLEAVTAGDVNGDGKTGPMDLSIINSYVNKEDGADYGNTGKYGINSKPSDALLVGDVNFDGIIDSQDAELISQYNVKSLTFTDEQLKAADVDLDCHVGAKDITYVNMYIASGSDGTYPGNVGMYSYKGFDSNISGGNPTETPTEPSTSEETTEPSSDEPTIAQTETTKPSTTEPTTSVSSEIQETSQANTENEKEASNPATGDTDNLILWIILAVVSLIAVATLFRGNRKKNRT